MDGLKVARENLGGTDEVEDCLATGTAEFGPTL